MRLFVIKKETKTMVLDNICYLLNDFISCSTYENIIFSRVMHEQAIIDQIIGSLNLQQCILKKISLVCTQETLKTRLQVDIDAGVRDAGIVEKSIERISYYEKLDTVKINTTEISVDEIAEIIDI